MQKSLVGASLAGLLRQYPEAVAPPVLAALDDLDASGLITLRPSVSGASIEWHGRAERAA